MYVRIFQVLMIVSTSLMCLPEQAFTYQSEGAVRGTREDTVVPTQTVLQEQASIPGTSNASSGYVLGPGDQIIVHALNVDEITDKPNQIDLNGFLHLPLAGDMKLSGLTVQQARSEISRRLQPFVLHPDVSIIVAEYRSQPVSVLGAVKNPGVQQVQGRRTLLEALSLAGGVDNAVAGPSLRITRRLEYGLIPLPGAITDPTNQFSTAQVDIKSLLEAQHPEQNVSVKSYDVISVPKAEIVYVIGEVLKPGGFILGGSNKVTVLQALSMAGGLDKMAQPKNARLLRQAPGASTRAEIPVNLKGIIDGKIEDVGMQPEDILFVPNNVPRRAAVRAIEAGVQMGTGMMIWRVR